MEISKLIEQDLDKTRSINEPFHIDNEDFIFVAIDTRRNRPIFPGNIKHFTSLDSDLANGAGGVMIALGGKFKKIKATPIAVDKRLALALRLELQIPLLIIALYLPSRYYNKNRTPSTTTSPSSSSSPQHDPNAFTTASEYAFNNYGRSNEFRIVILNKILQVIEANPDCRVIIAGDLNTNLPITDTRKETTSSG